MSHVAMARRFIIARNELLAILLQVQTDTSLSGIFVVGRAQQAGRVFFPSVGSRNGRLFKQNLHNEE